MTKSFPVLSRDVGIRTICVIRVPIPADSRDVACRVSPFNPLYATGICSVGQSLRTVRRGTPRLCKAAHCLLTTTTSSVFYPWSSVPSVSSVCSYLRTGRRGTPRLYKAAHCLLTTTTLSVIYPWSSVPSVSSVCPMKSGGQRHESYFNVPPIISSSSLVMACWRDLLYCLVRS